MNPSEPSQYENPKGQWQDDRRRDQSSMDLSWGGLTVVARGSIVVLALLSVVNGGLTLLTYSWMHGGVDHHTAGTQRAISAMQTEIGAMKGALANDNVILRQDIMKNRDFLREITRICLLTPEQSKRLQDNMPNSLRELLMRPNETQ